MTKQSGRPMTKEEIEKMVDPLYFAGVAEQKRAIQSRIYSRIDEKEKHSDGSEQGK